jgi:hypothetical protein
VRDAGPDVQANVFDKPALWSIVACRSQQQPPCWMTVWLRHLHDEANLP